MIYLIIIGCIVGYGLIAGVIHEFLPSFIEKMNKDGVLVCSIVWPLFIIILTGFGLVVGPFYLGKWSIKKLDERFDFRK